MRNLPLTFDPMYCSQKLGEDFANFLWPSQNIWTLRYYNSLILHSKQNSCRGRNSRKNSDCLKDNFLSTIFFFNWLAEKQWLSQTWFSIYFLFLISGVANTIVLRNHQTTNLHQIQNLEKSKMENTTTTIMGMG